MKKPIIRLVAWLLCFLLPLSAFVILVEALGDTYDKTYLGAFDEKLERLESAEGRRVIFIGGSSLPFGLRSDLLEGDLGGDYTVVNFGLYATLGTKFMMDMAKSEIREGDVVLLSPELSVQTYSLYFNPEAVLQATDGFDRSLLRLPLKNQISCFYSFFGFGFDKLGYHLNKNAPDPVGIYRADSFNEYGDLSVERPNNLMNNGVDENMLVTVDGLLNKEFIDYVNDYVAYAEKKGADIFFSFSPANRAALRSSAAARANFEEALAEALDCPLLGSVEDYLIDERYFYDTNFHLNDAGAIVYTRTVSLNLKRALGSHEVSSSLEIPTPPPLAQDTVADVPVSEEKIPFEEYLGEPNNDYLDWFEFRENGSTYTLIGVKEEHRGMTEVILPSVYNGKNVTAVAADAFRGCTSLKRIHIGSTYKSLAAGAFAGCISLEGIYLYEMDGNRIAPPTSGLMDGAAQSASIYIPEGANYTTGYTWSNYLESFKTFTREAD